jgi:hypothetical protein
MFHLTKSFNVNRGQPGFGGSLVMALVEDLLELCVMTHICFHLR